MTVVDIGATLPFDDLPVAALCAVAHRVPHSDAGVDDGHID